MQRRIMGMGAVIVLTIMGLGPWSSTALAAGRTVYVDDTGSANASQSGKCGRPNYATIQAAVADGAVSRIIVCAGTYSEQLTVTRSVTLEGRSGAIIQAPAIIPAFGAIVSFSGAQESRLRGFTISGASTTDANLNVAVEVRDGADVSIAHNQIRDMRDNHPSFDTGGGIFVSGGHADITDTTIERFDNEGIVLFGPDTFAAIDDTIIREPLREGTIGIDIREGAEAEVEDNTITGNRLERNAGIIVDLTSRVSLRDNTVTNNQIGIILGDEVGDTTVRSNTIRNNTSHGIFLTDASFNTIVENEIDHNGGDGIHLRTSPNEPNAFGNNIRTNKVHDNAGDGIHLDLGVVNTTIKENRALHNAGIDIFDANGGPPANTYQDNRCATSTPAGLCKP